MMEVEKERNRFRISEEIKMKIFQTIQRNMAAMGFTPNQPQNNYRQLKFGQIIIVGVCSIDAIKMGVYIFCEADGIEEYMYSIFSLTVVAGITISFISFIFKNDKLFNVIEIIAKELTNRK